MRTRVLSCAEQEFAEAVDYYNEQRPGLGYEFAAEVKSTLDRIASFPNAWPKFSHRARRCITNRFPYGVLYQVREDHVLVVAIMDLRRDPKRWEERLRKALGE
ncbi:MAG: type II toxin-antitoxin system RelE/ParE family toxin [Planctomycetes bacterium]|nr:type II toxin-antitoxin system RelE/ParE family toxin [Planctomycetota bacterium]MBM4081842.1 type II toxin-antitoxin system RelE/ParE family toxin [Planctomycetota bacterium]MBM4085116.1 type II toxin-antitoxin system RelE/ParE family toxin [Planctomycetota bacterium]